MPTLVVMTELQPGQHARSTMRQLTWRLAIALIVLLAGALVGLIVFGLRSGEFVLIELAAIGIMLVLESNVIPLIDRWDRGAEAEETIGALLDSLHNNGWYVIHGIDTGRGNIDHVAIGPSGLFTIETKSHRGRIRVDRIDEQVLKQAYAQRKWLERVCGERAEALLVFSGAYLDRPVSRRRGVVILPGRMLCSHLRRREPVWRAAQVGAVRARLAHALG